jgi:DNA-cytosine methyltransferase
MSEKYRSIDLFAGIGGIRMGFENAFRGKISTVFVSEWDPYARETYSANFGNEPPIAGDITRIDEKDIPAFDICLAGFPCQAFSIAGKKQGFNDDYKGMSRGTLFSDVVRICEYHRPKVIFCENVKGLVMHDKGRTLKVILGAFREIGYRTYYKVINSRDFGVPQNRERIYIVAFRNDIDDSRFHFPQPKKSRAKLKDIIEENPVSVKYYLSTTYLEGLKKHRTRHEAKGHGFGFEIKDMDGYSSAIVCGGMGRERNLIVDDRLTDFTPVTHIKGEVNREGIRKMTPREWARLQGFPDTFRLPLADTHLYKQLGNSVTVPVVQAIACEIRKVLETEQASEPVVSDVPITETV